jgi:hypothetical protein
MIVREEEWVLREATRLGLKPGTVLEVIENNGTDIKIKVGERIEEVSKVLGDQVLVVG